MIELADAIAARPVSAGLTLLAALVAVPVWLREAALDRKWKGGDR